MKARLAALTAAVAGAGALAGCSSATSATPAPASQQSVAASPLATSLSTAADSWAILPMAANPAFWQVFVRPAKSSTWQLATPPGVASNGGLVATGTGGSLTVAVRPSQGLTFSPLATSVNGGAAWSTGLLDAAIAAAPDALALDGGKMLALLDDGAIDQQTTSTDRWTALAAPGAIASSAAGRQCGVTGLSAVTLASSGTPLAAASCARPGVVGIFAWASGTWQPAGPTLSGPSGRLPVQVLRLTATSAGTVAVLQAGTGRSASLLAAWSADGSHWALSPPLPAGGSGQVRASGTGAEGTVWLLLASGRAVAVPGPGAPWRMLPAPPPGTAALAAGPGGRFDTLAASGGKLTVFRLSPAGTWRETQILSVPIQYGSSS